MRFFQWCDDTCYYSVNALMWSVSLSLLLLFGTGPSIFQLAWNVSPWDTASTTDWLPSACPQYFSIPVTGQYGKEATRLLVVVSMVWFHGGVCQCCCFALMHPCFIPYPQVNQPFMKSFTVKQHGVCARWVCLWLCALTWLLWWGSSPQVEGFWMFYIVMRQACSNCGLVVVQVWILLYPCLWKKNQLDLSMVA